MSLPLDLLPHILGFLDASDLETCTLVTVSFHRIARWLLFTHLVLGPYTWKAKATFLEDKGIELRPHVKKITLEINEDDGTSYATMELNAQPLLALLGLLGGPQLDALRIQSVEDCSWDTFPDSFLDTLTTKIFPFIRSLDLNKVAVIPLLTTLSHCLHLQSLSLSGMEYIIGISESGSENEEIIPWNLPRVTSLQVNIFGIEDFGDEDAGPTSLKQYILLAGSGIRSLHLGLCGTRDFPLKWDFLRPFHDLRNSLIHLSFGSHLYETVVTQYEKLGMDPSIRLEFSIFSQLQSISFTTPHAASPTGWEPWWRCLTQSFDYPQNTLKVLRFYLHSTYCPEFVSTNPLDNMAEETKFEIHIVACGDIDGAGFVETARAFRMNLPSWDAAAKLKISVGESGGEESP
ncbi:hypothetical protein DL96DRAFT_1810842 [Flagelloscypha sp. PMI_526]|nr:hypothetical protein DL96DRAFT_1810842 [Flagelloscypha sp. PMI_526]